MPPSRRDTALDELFSEPVESFMSKREELAAELRTAGDKEGAATIKSQHKPTIAAHALNQLAHNAKAELNALFAAAHRLASGKDFKSALETQREALDDVRKKIPAAHASEIVAVLRGAMVDQDLAKRVMLGHFSKIPEVQVGFFGAAPEPGSEQPSKKHTLHAVPAPADHPAARARAKEKELAEKARKQQEAAEMRARKIEAAERDLARLSAAADEAELNAQEARRLATEAEHKAVQARRHAEHAEEKLRKIEKGD